MRARPRFGAGHRLDVSLLGFICMRVAEVCPPRESKGSQRLNLHRMHLQVQVTVRESRTVHTPTPTWISRAGRIAVWGRYGVSLWAKLVAYGEAAVRAPHSSTGPYTSYSNRMQSRVMLTVRESRTVDTPAPPGSWQPGRVSVQGTHLMSLRSVIFA